MTSTLITHVRATRGDAAVEEVLSRAGLEHSERYLCEVGNWIWYAEAVALFDASAEVTGDDEIGRRVGEQAVRQHAGTPVATLMRSLGSPEAIFEQLTVGVSKFSTVTELEPLEVAPGRAVVRATGRPGFPRHPHLCGWTHGLLATPPELFGLPPARVEESSCAARGDECCLYTVTWDAERAASRADPQQLVTALESQLAAMTERLQTMYATARDLIAVEDLDTTLKRITDRAATAVRAPKYLLAVRTAPDAPLHVHHRGFAGDDADAAACALIEGQDSAVQGVRLVSEVSGARQYGRLMAVSPAGGFLAYERDVFDVYARFAAAVLDSATAFEEARRRDEQSRALLALSRALATATTRDEVAQRIADTVPDVIDCERVVTFLWDEQDEVLECSALTGFCDERDELVRRLRVRASDTEALAELIATQAPRPLFFDPDCDDEFIAATMRRTGARKLVLVPIVARDRFYGTLNVSVTDRPERLDPSPGLAALLEGVAAQAATALESARLIETMAHQARFDNLTGLLGHRAFHEALELQLDRVGGSFTLAAIDIDDFKLVNDLHGHPVGDEALRRVAEALRGAVRDHDAIFRVGGEEFALLLPDTSRDDAHRVAERLRAAVASVPFLLPLRVSIGLAVWPHDARDRDRLLERADAALYAAKRAGKDRTVGASDADAPVAGEPSAPHAGLLDRLRSKDVDTAAHSARVAALAVEVGRLLGVDGDRLGDLRIAAQLHDIGKLAVPDAVLGKPGPLDEEELRIVRTHPLVGAELVRAWGLARVARFVVEHHERIDGGGYPAGLAGDAITLEGRILHVADAFAAMTSDRPYRRAMSAGDALAELRSLAGSQFDESVVRALAAALETRAAELPAWTVDSVAGEDARRVAD